MAHITRTQHHKFGILWCEDSAKWAGNWSLYPAAFQEPKDEAYWEVFNVFEGQLPPLDLVHEYSGFVISGSHCSSYDDQPWIKQLHEWIRGYRDLALKQASGPQLVGICFGHQAIGDALGGRVAPNGLFVLGLERLQPTEGFMSKPYVRQALAELGLDAVPQTVHVLQSHGDAVVTLPPGAELLASSANTAVEMYTIADRIIGIQGHPEFAPGLLKEKIMDSMVARGGLTTEAAAEIERVMAEEPLHHTFLRKVIHNFIYRCAATSETATLEEMPVA